MVSDVTTEPEGPQGSAEAGGDVAQGLPEWVIDRCDRAKIQAFCHRGARHEELTREALAEFLRIIEERAGPGWMIMPMTDDDPPCALDELLETADAAYA